MTAGRSPSSRGAAPAPASSAGRARASASWPGPASRCRPGSRSRVDAFAAALAAVDPTGALRAGIVGAAPRPTWPRSRPAAARLRALVTGAPLPAEVAAAIAAGVRGAGRGSATGIRVADVAVRSSATVEDSAEASFAGLQDTYLGRARRRRRCSTTCGAAGRRLYNDESVAYRRRLGLPEDGVAMAVVVQRMVAPRAAGVMFTRSPVTGRPFGGGDRGHLGPRLGAGLRRRDPGRFIVSKITGEITGRRVSPKVHHRTRFIPNGPGVDRRGHPVLRCARRPA